jgi:hypothetical protein
MLLAPFTLHKVQKYFSGFGLGRKEEVIRWLWVEACDPPELGWRNTDGWRTRLKSFQWFTFPNGNQLAPDSILQLIWCHCKNGIPCSSRDRGYKRYFDAHEIFCACSGYCASLKCILSRYCFQIREQNWWWTLAF